MKVKQGMLPGSFFAMIVYLGMSCTTATRTPDTHTQIQRELAIIDTLLRDKSFAESMATTLDSAYYAGVGQTAPPFLTAADDAAFVTQRVKDETTAINLAGFYALECGLGLLSTTTHETPVEWLIKIRNGDVDSGAVLLLNRFANATWKAGQPFRSLGRITRYNFTGASLLPPNEVKKDFIQVSNAAEKLLNAMEPVRKSPMAQQMQVLRRLLQDTSYALEMARFLDSSYAVSQNQKPGLEIFSAHDTATGRKRTKEIKIATSIAGFYALECGLNYLVTTRKMLPSAILNSLVNDSINKEDKMIFARFANATWKAGQPFRGLNRITRETFTPFYFLSTADIEKDLIQVRTAAQRVLSML